MIKNSITCSVLVNSLFEFLFIEKLKYEKHEFSAKRRHSSIPATKLNITQIQCNTSQTTISKLRAIIIFQFSSQIIIIIIIK